MTEKLERVPPAWAKVHAQSQRALLRAEIAAVAGIRAAAKAVHAVAISDLAAARSHIAAITTVQRARPELARAVGSAILAARTAARTTAIARVQRELVTLRSEAQGSDFEALAPDPGQAKSDTQRHAAEAAALMLFLLRSGKSADIPIARSDATEDRVLATSIGESYATAWASAMLGTILRWERTPREERPPLTEGAARILDQTDGRIRRIGATETSRAYNNEHDEALRGLVKPPSGATLELETARVGIMAGLFVRWDATLDRRTCKVCRDHDGEVVPVGMPFRAGDKPGDVHVMCRCIETLIFLPGRIGQA